MAHHVITKPTGRHWESGGTSPVCFALSRFATVPAEGDTVEVHITGGNEAEQGVYIGTVAEVGGVFASVDLL